LKYKSHSNYNNNKNKNKNITINKPNKSKNTNISDSDINTLVDNIMTETKPKTSNFPDKRLNSKKWKNLDLKSLNNSFSKLPKQSTLFKHTPVHTIIHHHHHHRLNPVLTPSHSQSNKIQHIRNRQTNTRYKRLKQVQSKINPSVLTHLINVSNDLSLNKNLIGGSQPIQPLHAISIAPETRKSGMNKESKKSNQREVLDKEEHEAFNETEKNKGENTKDDLIDKNLTLFSLEKSQMAAN